MKRLIAVLLAGAGLALPATIAEADIEVNASSPYLTCATARDVLNHSSAVGCYHPGGNPQRVALWYWSWPGQDRAVVYWNGYGWRLRACHCGH